MRKHTWTKEFAAKAAAPHAGRDYVIKPELLALMGPLKGKDVLELGVGTGYWVRAFTAKGARCVGIDASANQLAIAAEKTKGLDITYTEGDIRALRASSFKRKFDFVVIEHVLLEMSAVKDIELVFKGAARVLKKNGRLIVSDVHPVTPSIKEWNNIKTPKGYHYFDSGALFEGISTTADGKKVHYFDHHWTLEDYSRSLEKAGFAIEALREPRPTAALVKRYPNLGYRFTKPMSLIIKARLT